MAEFKLGRIKLVWKGPWQGNQPYYKDDIVSYGGYSYICISSHTSGVTLVANQANWQIMTGGTDWKSDYVVGTFYKEGDIVSYGANLYICTTPYTSGSSLDDNINNWDLYVPSVNFRGEWVTGQVYTLNDLVKYNANVFICTTRHVSTASFVSSNFDEFVQGLQFEDNWNSSLTYAQGDIVTYGGYNYVALQGNSNKTPSTETAYWDVFTTGFNVVGVWSTSTNYKVGDVVQYGGYSYVAKVDSSSRSPYIGTQGVNSNYWTLVVKGLAPNGTWDAGTTYAPGDVVERNSNSYIATAVSLNEMPPNATFWTLLAQGSVGAVLTKRGDVPYRTQGGSIIGLSMDNGTVPGTGVVEGYVLKAKYINSPTPGLEPRYEEFGYVANVWYVAPSGEDEEGYGRTIDRPFRTIKYATSVVTSGAIFIKTGTYKEQLPIRVPPSVSVIGDELRTVTVMPGTEFSAITTSCVATVNFISSIAAKVVMNTAFTGTTYQTSVQQSILGVSSTASVVTSINTSFSMITSIMVGGTPPTLVSAGPITGDVYKLNARTLLLANKTYLKAEATAYLSTVYSYTNSTSAKDISKFVDAVINDLIYGGNSYSRSAALSFRYASLGISDDGVTPNNRSRMWLVNNGSVIRNMTMSGLTGQFTGVQLPSGSGVQRVTTNWPSATASGCYVSLDPTGSISSRSPYIQNCTVFGTRAVGVLIDGNIQTGGYKSMTLNDFTQIIDDGIAIWAKAGGRAELVSVFTYYAYIGYLAETGGILRSLNGNNSYGTYGDVSTDLDPTDLGFTGSVNNRSTEARVGRVITGEGRVTGVLWDYQGQNYSVATIEFEGAPVGGTTAVATPVFTNGAVSHIDVTSGGANYQYITGTGRAGGTNGNGTWFSLAATDAMSINNQYQGMRLIVTEGLGSGQYATIKNSYVIDAGSGYTRVVYLQNDAGVDGWETMTGDVIVTALDQSTKYEIVAKVAVNTSGYSPSRTAKVFAQVDPETNTINAAYILDGGQGYLPGTLPTFTITDPGASSTATFVAQVKDGAISRLEYSTRGTGYLTAGVTEITGNGYAEIAQYGTNINFLGMTTKAPRPGSIMTIAGQTGNFLVIETTSYDALTGAAAVSVSPAIDRTTPVSQGATATVYEKYSQVRLTGHDYLAIGTGNFASTVYPNVTTLNYIRANEKKNLNNGRVFYVSTDQDGNLSVGDLFQVNQATGQATLNVSSFNLTGLNSLQLGSAGATIFSFSADGTMSANSDNIVPTQRSIRTYINSQLGSGSNALTVNVLTAGKIYIENEVIGTSVGTNSDIILQADGTGKIQVNSQIQYAATYTQMAALPGNQLVNKNYADEINRSTLHALTLDSDGQLLYTSDVGSVGATVDATGFTEFFNDARVTSIAVSGAGNLQITY
jgi:hypothetical protein